MYELRSNMNIAKPNNKYILGDIFASYLSIFTIYVIFSRKYQVIVRNFMLAETT